MESWPRGRAAGAFLSEVALPAGLKSPVSEELPTPGGAVVVPKGVQSLAGNAGACGRTHPDCLGLHCAYRT